ncbi:DUF305 domain-containing protein [Microbacterium bovistercoris]|uniref:DUF305 domain-containing protein n=2 Tax=Microbacterium bovistercoris TaxID=2293570 RepID=A0A371NSK3_9MICO|nr:DUF305 domain-containing protein [Microbacterium bovistercoris]
MPGMSQSPASDAVANDADAMFASMMIVHHEQAIEMSDLVLAKEGLDPDVADLATRIKEAQGPEIEQLNGWLDDWDVPAADDSMDHDDGMMSADDMAALEAASGADAGKLFLEQMIVHHEGAVNMAEDEVENGKNPDATALAQKIIDAQTDEIAEMRGLLAG